MKTFFRFSSFGFIILLLAFVMGCQREDVDNLQNSSPDSANFSSFTPVANEDLIQMVKDNIENSIFKELTADAGIPLWDCAYVELQDEGTYKIVVPYRFGLYNTIDNILIAFRSPSDTWSVKLINRYMYEFKALTTKFEANKLVYEAFLNEFDNAEAHCNQTTSFSQKTESRTVIPIWIIEYDNGDQWILYSDGTIVIIPAANNGGTGSGTTGTITWANGGGCFSFPGDNIISNNGNDPNNWNNLEELPSYPWANIPTHTGGGTSISSLGCQSSTFWKEAPATIKKEYTKYLAELMKNSGINNCSNPFLSDDEKKNCFTETEILCSGVNSGCIVINDGHIDYGNFMDCMGAVMNRLPCMNVAENFLSTYGLNMSVDELEKLLGGFGGNCSDQEEFHDYVLDQLFKIELSKKPSGGIVINLANEFKNCFGTPDANGNYIDCSQNGNADFNLTLFAEQPSPGSRDPYSGNPLTGIDVGHTFISLSTNFGGNQKTITFGFYPSKAVDLNNTTAPMSIYDDGGHNFSVSATIQLSCSQFNQLLINSVNATSNNYDLNNFNCTDFGIQIANSVNLGVTDTTSPWIYLGKTYGNSSNPGDLGEDIKNLNNANINSNGGSAPSTNCN